jgi:hypothetical protein
MTCACYVYFEKKQRESYRRVMMTVLSSLYVPQWTASLPQNWVFALSPVQKCLLQNLLPLANHSLGDTPLNRAKSPQ